MKNDKKICVQKERRISVVNEEKYINLLGHFADDEFIIYERLKDDDIFRNMKVWEALVDINQITPIKLDRRH